MSTAKKEVVKNVNEISEINNLEKTIQIPIQELERLMAIKKDYDEKQAKIAKELEDERKKIEALLGIIEKIKSTLVDSKGNFSKAKACFRYRFENFLSDYKKQMPKDIMELFIKHLTKGEGYKTYNMVEGDHIYVFELLGEVFNKLEASLSNKGVNLKELLKECSLIK